ncbi:MFS transporter [Streptomyces sp. NPDC005708]|uniref:MFS transporter n=1 Tax=Streptomyces sp. NPDC005708 TaxID=3154564 RepID=UPI0033DBE7D6
MSQAMTTDAAQAGQSARSSEIGSEIDDGTPSGPRGGRLSGTPALYLLASVFVSLLASSSAPTPLYTLYQARWGFSPITTTVVFGVYAVCVLVSLLTVGKLSDHVGRRPVLLVTLLIQVATMVVFATADGVPSLMVARVVQGVATGAAIGAVGAGMLDIDARRGQLANAVAPTIGTGSGALVSALLVRYLPAPTHLVYFLLLALFALQAVGVALMRETVTRAPGALASLRPEFTLPRQVRAHVLAAAPVLFAGWALAGLYGALGPALVATLTRTNAEVLGGLTLFVLAGVAGVTVAVLRNAQPGTMMLIGIGALPVGVVVTLLALAVESLPLFFVGTAISGAAFGAGFQGGIRTVASQVAPHERAGTLSLLYVISYLGFGLPVVAAGFLIVHGAGLLGATQDYGAAMIVLAAAALLALLRIRRTARPVE